MRYRPFAQTGIAVSGLSLSLNGASHERTEADWRDLVHGAFEEGVNSFEVAQPTPAVLAGMAEAIGAVRRSLLFVSLRLQPGLAPQTIESWVEGVIAAAGLGELNLLTSSAEPAELGPAVAPMQRLKDRKLVKSLGAAGSEEQLEPFVAEGFFDAILTPFNMLSAWRDRHLIRTALERQMGVIVCDPCPEQLAPMVEQARSAARPGFFKRMHPLAGAGSYAFLASTPGWSAEQICIAYALTEPAVASVQMEAMGRKHLTQLAEATARDLPAAVSAQIEMARFSIEKRAQEQRARRLSA
jgi:aryl-alcohol dehydrogenase-like predicted oxidoreductase